jgi:hypothetical protein
VIAAVRDIGRAATVFKGTGIDFLPAPVAFLRNRRRFDPPQCYAHLLSNIGFSDSSELATLVAAWRTLYECVRPELVVADHAPTALVALRGYRTKRVALGTGFGVPPDTSPMPLFDRPGRSIDSREVERDEERLLGVVNSVVASTAGAAIDRLSQLFNDVDETVLGTYPELDHFGERPGARYWGAWPFLPGAAPTWPNAPGSRIFAYLKPFKALPNLLDLLRKSRLPTLLVSDGIEPSMYERYASDTLRVERQIVDLRQAMQECDVTVLNGGHGTVAASLLSGRPCLVLPLHVEQYLTAKRVGSFGAGRMASPSDAEQITAAFQELLSSRRYAEKAQRFAERYAQPGQGQRVLDVVDRMEQLFEGR